jgi:hypothetical protein
MRKRLPDRKSRSDNRLGTSPTLGVSRGLKPRPPGPQPSGGCNPFNPAVTKPADLLTFSYQVVTGCNPPQPQWRKDRTRVRQNRAGSDRPSLNPKRCPDFTPYQSQVPRLGSPLTRVPQGSAPRSLHCGTGGARLNPVAFAGDGPCRGDAGPAVKRDSAEASVAGKQHAWPRAGQSASSPILRQLLSMLRRQPP